MAQEGPTQCYASLLRQHRESCQDILQNGNPKGSIQTDRAIQISGKL